MAAVSSLERAVAHRTRACFEGVRDWGDGRTRDARSRPFGCARRIRGHRRRERVGQIDDDEHHRVSRSSDAWDLYAGRHRGWESVRRLSRHRSQPRHRLHLPGVQLAAPYDRARKRRATPAVQGGSACAIAAGAPAPCSKPSVSATDWIIRRTNSRAASSNGWPLPARS